MSDFVTTAWVVVCLVFLFSLLLLFLQVDLGPDASITGGIGIGAAAFLGLVVLLVYGLPPDLVHFLVWFFGGVLLIMLVVAFHFTLRGLLDTTLG